MRADELEQRKKEGDPFATNVLNEPKLMITGTRDD